MQVVVVVFGSPSPGENEQWEITPPLPTHRWGLLAPRGAAGVATIARADNLEKMTAWVFSWSCSVFVPRGVRSRCVLNSRVLLCTYWQAHGDFT